ncbi:nucleoside 2-deoxyribosyltransferase domain-containing protein [Candidatus Poribacteria bacterium]
MLEIKAPENYILSKERKSIFLAGSIEMGEAEDWQLKVKEALEDKDVLLLNPRRDDWDNSWEQSIDNQPFREHVVWELTAMENADIIIFNFVAGTKSPIALLELGLFKDKKIFVCCPEGYWRQGNVEIVCSRYGIPFFEDLEKMIQTVRSHLCSVLPTT